MPQLDPTKFPGYLEQVAQESLLRDAAFLPVNESICGFEVCQMTLRHWLILRVAKSPFITGGIPNPKQLALFLWILNPIYNAEGRRRRRFMFCCRWAFRKEENVRTLVGEARKYVAETMQDGEFVRTENYEPSYYSMAAHFCGLLGMHLGFSEDDVMAMPLRRLFQYVKVIRDLIDSGVPKGNPSDRILCDALEKQNAERRRN